MPDESYLRAAPEAMSPDVAAAVEAFIERHGEAALLATLEYAPIIEGLGAASKLALKGAREHTQAQLPSVLIVKADPRNKSSERRLDVRLLTGGQVELTIDLGRADS